MAKYDWNQLEKEYILGDYKSIKNFIESKKIPYNGTTRMKTTGWSEKKRHIQEQKATKTIEKVIERDSAKEAEKIIKINDVANELLKKIIIATDNLGKESPFLPDTIKKLTSSLKDIKEIIPQKPEEENDDNSFIEALNSKAEDIWNEEE